MFIKLALICLAIVPLIVGKETENPDPSATTRVGKFLGFFAVHNNHAGPLKLLLSANKRWSGELSLSFGRRPLIASGIAVGYQQHLDFPIEQPQFSQGNLPLQQFDSSPSNATSASGIDDAESTEVAALDSTTETMQASRTLKLEDYDEITFDPDVDGNRVRREATWSVPNGNNRGLRAEDDGVDSTTVESSTMDIMMQDESNFVTMAPPPVSQAMMGFQNDQTAHQPMKPHQNQQNQESHHTLTSQQGYHHTNYPYPPSRNPAAQYISITTAPYLPPVQNHHNFYPSQLDYFHHQMPYCFNPIYHKFTPVAYDNWNYRKWK